MKKVIQPTLGKVNIVSYTFSVKPSTLAIVDIVYYLIIVMQCKFASEIKCVARVKSYCSTFENVDIIGYTSRTKQRIAAHVEVM